MTDNKIQNQIKSEDTKTINIDTNYNLNRLYPTSLLNKMSSDIGLADNFQFVPIKDLRDLLSVNLCLKKSKNKFLKSQKLLYYGDVGSNTIFSKVVKNFNTPDVCWRNYFSQKHDGWLKLAFLNFKRTVKSSIKLMILQNEETQASTAILVANNLLNSMLFSCDRELITVRVGISCFEFQKRSVFSREVVESQGLFSLMSTTDELFKKMSSALSQENCDIFSSTLSSIQNTLDNKEEFTDNLVGKGFELSKSLTNEAMKKMSLLAAVAAVMYSFKEKNYLLITGALSFVAITHKDNVKELYEKIDVFDKIKSYFTEEFYDATEAQSGLADHSADIASAISLFLIGKDVQSKKNSNMSDIFKSFGAAKMTIQSIVTMLIKFVETALYSTGNGRYYEKLFMLVNPTDPTYLEYSEKVFKIDEEYLTKKLVYTVDNYERLSALLREGEKLLRDLPRNQSTQGLFSTMNSAVQRVRSYKKNFMDSGFLVEGLRQEPVAILLRGGPGTLKTQTMQHLSHALVSAVIEPHYRESFNRNPESFIYNRQVETEYWDGYDHHRIVATFDDLLQIRDVAGGGDSEVFNIIRAINENAYDLHMASLENKGSTKFRCKFVVATTNSAHLNVQSIHDKRALLRRFHKTYTVYPKKKYSKSSDREVDMAQKVDMSALPIGELNITSTNPDEVLEFHEYDLIENRATGVVVSFKEMVSILLERYHFNKKCYDQKVLELKARREEYAVQPQGFFDFVKNKFSSEKEEFFDVKEYFDGETEAHLWLLDILGTMPNDESVFLHKVFNAFGPREKSILIKRIITITDVHMDFKTDIKEEELVRYCFSLGWVRNALLNFSMPAQKIRDELLRDNEFLKFLPMKDLSIHVGSKSFYTQVSDHIKSIKSFISGDAEYNEWKTWKSVLAVAGSTAGVVGLLFAYKERKENKLIKSVLTNVEEAEGDYKMKPRKTVKQKNRRFSAKQMRSQRAQPQISLVVDNQGEDLVKKALRFNMYEFAVSKGEDDDYKKCGFITFVRGNVALIPHHFCDIIKTTLDDEPELCDSMTIRLTGSNNSKEGAHVVYYKANDILANVFDTDTLFAQDLAMIAFPSMSPRRDLMKYIYSARDLENMAKSPACVLGVSGSEISLTHMRGYAMEEEVVVDSKEIEEYSIKIAMSYNLATRKGDCGALLSVLNPALEYSKICGIHVAGTPSRNLGYASLFSKEDLLECMIQISDEHKVYYQMDDCNLIIKNELVGDGRFGQVRDIPVGPSLASKTKIMPSSLHGFITEPFMAPAKLKSEYIDGAELSPWKNAMKNYNMETPVFDKEVIETSVEQYKDFLFANSPSKVEPRLFTFDESVIGIPGTEFDSLNRGTSAGFPNVINISSQFKGKTYFFGNDDEFDLNSEACQELRADVNNCIENGEKLIRDEHIFMDCLKDELRPLDKVEEFKTRLISGSPLRLLILYRMYFGAFMLWYKVNRINNQSAIGVNVFSMEWDYAAKKLSKYSPGNAKNVGAGDYSKFDGSEKPYIHEKILEVINEWYDDCQENRNVRRTLWLELTNSLHVQGKCVYEWFTSLPSGHPLTPIVNTMYNGIAFRYCWNRAFKNDDDYVNRFDDNCYLLALGDDNVFSVRNSLRERFTEVVVGKYMAELGLTYTSEIKDAVNVEMRHLNEVEFLKRKWKYNNIAHRYVAPLRLNRLLETLNWTKRGGQSDQITCDNIDSILRELTLHGREVYDVYSKKIIKAGVDHLDYYPKCSSYDRNFKAVSELELFC